MRRLTRDAHRAGPCGAVITYHILCFLRRGAPAGKSLELLMGSQRMAGHNRSCNQGTHPGLGREESPEGAGHLLEPFWADACSIFLQELLFYLKTCRSKFHWMRSGSISLGCSIRGLGHNPIAVCFGLNVFHQNSHVITLTCYSSSPYDGIRRWALWEVIRIR